MVTPGCAVTLAGEPGWTLTAVRCWVQSTSTTCGGAPVSSTTGDQL
jgi:hypothetical protein